MKKLLGGPCMVLVGVACCMMVFPLQALGTGQNVQARITAPLSLSELAAMPRLGELQVGDRHFSLERVQNGFVARDVESGESVVVTDEALLSYAVTMPAVSSDAPLRLSVSRQQLLGAGETLSVEAEEVSESSFAGTISYGSTNVPIAYRSSMLDSAGDRRPSDSQDLRRVSGEVIVVIVISAAVVGVVSCAVVALMTNCITDCSDACSACGASMISASEGWCGQCTCQCQTPRIIAEIPNGEGCGVYH